MLTTEGMSSDESGLEERKYTIRIRQWRSAALIPYLEIIDRDMNKKNGLGKPIPGNPARQRVRMGGLISRSRAIPGLPANFYDATWYAGLSDSTKVDLQVKPAIALPTIMTDN